ncbi:serine/threonine-protein phosphatase BSL3-like [Beta vulgaris subsp. vulgaris]|uniref:serine/threonine-protein phosphatase BSL3-like n=1 Tax=Beta vulgaris subsp. vulgaris TaxID=3555 RepID=UPI002546B4BC|nr:serine/threonine-protein phosphatase BSL3-like [Beta vulgaris subsp. vulgaris]
MYAIKQRQQRQQQQQQQQLQGQIVGPRCAPSYSVVNAIIDKKEDGAGPRCGHTLTAVLAVGEEGSPGYIGPRLILFGGATALEGNSAATGTPSSAGSAGIKGSTNSQGVVVAVTRFPMEQKRPIGPLVVVGVKDGVLWLIDR